MRKEAYHENEEVKKDRSRSRIGTTSLPGCC